MKSKNFKRCDFIKTGNMASLGLLFSTSIGCTNLLGRKRPNILFIMSVDHGYQAVSAYGSKINNTPNIARAGLVCSFCW